MRENLWKNYGKSSKRDDYHVNEKKKKITTYKILQKQKNFTVEIKKEEASNSQ
jgi:hypothetical protein